MIYPVAWHASPVRAAPLIPMRFVMLVLAVAPAGLQSSPGRGRRERAGLDLPRAAAEKIAKNEAKYPVEKARGNARKYTEL